MIVASVARLFIKCHGKSFAVVVITAFYLSSYCFWNAVMLYDLLLESLNIGSNRWIPQRMILRLLCSSESDPVLLAQCVVPSY